MNIFKHLWMFLNILKNVFEYSKNFKNIHVNI